MEQIAVVQVDEPGGHSRLKVDVMEGLDVVVIERYITKLDQIWKKMEPKITEYITKAPDIIFEGWENVASVSPNILLVIL